MKCPLCKIEARVQRVEEKPDSVVTTFICSNLRCPNSRKVVGEKVITKEPKQER